MLITRGGERLMFDCGEGTQRQLQRSTGLAQVDAIHLTHFHADHVLGLPGLLKTYNLTDRWAPLTIYGPLGLGEFFSAMSPMVGRLNYEFWPGVPRGCGGRGSSRPRGRDYRRHRPL